MLRLKAVILALLFAVTTPAVAQDEFLVSLYGDGVHTFFRGNYPEALETFTAAVDAGLEDARCYYYRGLTQLRLGRDTEARADFGRGAELEGTSLAQIEMVSRAIQRVQGRERMQLERFRERARTVAYEEVRQEKAALVAQRMKEAEAARHVAARPVHDPAAVQDEVVALAKQYFTSLVKKDRDAISAVLTPKASETFANVPLDVTPSESAVIQFGQVQINGDEAVLPVMITDGDLKLGGSLLVRFANDGWRMWGQTLTGGPGSPELVLNFEDAPSLLKALTELQNAVAAASQPAPTNPPAAGAGAAGRPAMPADQAATQPATAEKPDPFAADAAAKPINDDPFASRPVAEIPAATADPLGAAEVPAADEPTDPAITANEEVMTDESVAEEEGLADDDPLAPRPVAEIPAATADPLGAAEVPAADEPTDPAIEANQDVTTDESVAKEEAAINEDPFATEPKPADKEAMPADKEAPKEKPAPNEDPFGATEEPANKDDAPADKVAPEEKPAPNEDPLGADEKPADADDMPADETAPEEPAADENPFASDEKPAADADEESDEELPQPSKEPAAEESDEKPAADEDPFAP